MIDIEVEVFDKVANAILAEYPDAYITSENVAMPSKFPAVTVIETTNTPAKSRFDSSGREKAATLTYTVNVYSNSESNKKGECKRITAIVSEVMNSLNMVRTTCSPIDNLADPSIYRMAARYTCMVDENNIIYRR